MNWETYKTLTPEQKEEYDFRNKHKGPIFDSGMYTTISLLMLIVINLFLSAYIIQKEFVAVPKLNMDNIMNSVIELLGVIPLLIIIFLIGYIIEMIWRTYKEFKWRKKNNIKSINRISNVISKVFK